MFNEVTGRYLNLHSNDELQERPTNLYYPRCTWNMILQGKDATLDSQLKFGFISVRTSANVTTYYIIGARSVRRSALADSQYNNITCAEGGTFHTDRCCSLYSVVERG
jgi:hypothetical protein